MVCNEEASFTKRIVDDTALQVIGGSDKYVAVCRNCFQPNTTSRQEPKTPPTNKSQSNHFTKSPVKSPMRIQ